jgi:hypothetical protein
MGQKATNRSRAKPHRCPLWSESGQNPARLVCPLSASRVIRCVAEKRRAILPSPALAHKTHVLVEEPSTASIATLIKRGNCGVFDHFDGGALNTI